MKKSVESSICIVGENDTESVEHVAMGKNNFLYQEEVLLVSDKQPVDCRIYTRVITFAMSVFIIDAELS